MSPKVIAVDFDGTMVIHKYPFLGRELPNAVNVLQRLLEADHKLILLTMRSGMRLEEAVDWFKNRDVDIWSVNRNPDQFTWTISPKVFANLYIDDAALGCPLNRGSVDWYEVEKWLEERGFLD